MKIFDSKKQAQKIEWEILNLLKKNPNIGNYILAIVIVGNDSASRKFIKIKTRLCDRLGIRYEVFDIDDILPDKKIFSEVEKIFKDSGVGGGIIQLPLPRQSLQKILGYIPLNKDIDVISSIGMSRFYSGDFSFVSPVVRAFENFIDFNQIELRGLKAVVIGDGELVGKPISFYLSKKGSDVKLLSDYNGLGKIECDLLVLAAGVPNLVKGENVSLGCDVVDFGSSVVEGRCVGDLDMRSGLDHLGCVSKSPGGMGPLVVRYLVENFVNNLIKD